MGSGMIKVSGCCLRKLVRNHYAELETAGKCFEWSYTSLYDFLSEEVGKVPPGANVVIFTPC